ncbi:nucleotide exchange factor GrpE [Desulfurispira natronophila]|uniref:Protein GrpE n=1 Tax=Desulfurispira natronophila TaxID=682562 RepID=A0A7W8DGE3_9BACT|nr:nucleotide exchange factor GrpE [Desulfurispira natronophila]MBB5021317.1 molecular chaperone GrpE [Desulfurispira natronophila]
MADEKESQEVKNQQSDSTQEPLAEAGQDGGLQETVQRLESRLQLKEDEVLRLHAEFENFKRRNTKERQEGIRYANQQLIKEMLTVLDNLDLALSHMGEDSSSTAIGEGVELTRKQLMNVLEKHGLEIITTDGEFDPNEHEAVMQENSADHDNNHIVDTLQKGYKLYGRTIRPAMVKVCKK